MNELWRPVGEVVRERIASPVVGPLLASWMAWNYKFFVILLSVNSVTVTHALVAKEYAHWWDRAGQGFLYPLTSAAIYALLVPHLEKWVLSLSLEVQKAVLKLRREHANLELLTRDEGDKLKTEMAELRSSHQHEIERKNAEIATRKEATEKLRVRLDQQRSRSVETELINLDVDLMASERTALKLIYESKEPMRPDYVREGRTLTEIPEPQRGLAIRALRQRGFIEVVDADDLPALQLTPLGRRNLRALVGV